MVTVSKIYLVYRDIEMKLKKSKMKEVADVIDSMLEEDESRTITEFIINELVE